MIDARDLELGDMVRHRTGYPKSPMEVTKVFQARSNLFELEFDNCLTLYVAGGEVFIKE